MDGTSTRNLQTSTWKEWRRLGVCNSEMTTCRFHLAPFRQQDETLASVYQPLSLMQSCCKVLFDSLFQRRASHASNQTVSYLATSPTIGTTKFCPCEYSLHVNDRILPKLSPRDPADQIKSSFLAGQIVQSSRRIIDQHLDLLAFRSVASTAPAPPV